MKVPSVESLREDPFDVCHSMQEHPEIWDEAARKEAQPLVEDLYSLLEAIREDEA